MEKAVINMSKFSHIDEQGNAIMVDVSNKEVTKRSATAIGKIYMSKEAYELVKENKNKKGDVLTVGQIAGIMGGKKTSELVPLCHPLLINKLNVTFSDIEEKDKYGFIVHSEVHVEGKTGAEMEALTAVEIALLTVYDMCKAVDKRMVITDIHLESKSGGKSGDFKF